MCSLVRRYLNSDRLFIFHSSSAHSNFQTSQSSPAMTMSCSRSLRLSSVSDDTSTSVFPAERSPLPLLRAQSRLPIERMMLTLSKAPRRRARFICKLLPLSNHSSKSWRFPASSDESRFCLRLLAVTTYVSVSTLFPSLYSHCRLVFVLLIPSLLQFLDRVEERRIVISAIGLTN